MRQIPPKLKAEIAADPYYKICARKIDPGHTCAGRITWEHSIIYAGKQLNEKWAIIPLCEVAHSVGMFQDAGDLNKEINVYLALNRATDAELKAISKVTNYIEMRKRLNMKYDLKFVYKAVVKNLAKKPKNPKEKKEKIKRNLNYESQNFLGKVVLDEDETKEIRKKRIRLNSPVLYQTFVDNMCKVGDEISMYITNTKPLRSERQNRYLHLYLSLIALTHEGNTVEDLKDWIHQYHLVEKISIIKGVEVKTCKSTAALKVGEFCEMLAWVEKESGIPLPDTEPFLKPLTHEEYAKLKGDQLRIYSKLVMKKI